MTIANVCETIVALSVLLTALSHILPGKVGHVLGELGVDIAGAIKELRK